MNKCDKAHLVDGKYGIRDLVDLAELRGIFERFTEATGFTIGFLDHPDMNVLIASGWRDICTQFHRGRPASADNCTKSNRHLLDQLDAPGKLLIESCDNGLVDCAFPIIVKGKHIASLATGQLLTEKPDLERFRRQARLFGFDEHEYLRALAEVPVIPEEKLRRVTTFLGEMARVLSELGYAHLIAQETNERLQNEIAERQQAKEAQRVSEARLTFAMQTCHTGAWDLDLLDHTAHRTLMHDQIFGYESLLPRWTYEMFLEHVLPEDRPEVDRRFREATATQTGWNFECRIRRADGEARWIWAVGDHERNAEGKAIRMSGIVQDITERKRTEAEREKLEAQLRQAQKMESVGRLAGGVAHDFNNMLQIILGHTEMALEQVAPSLPLHDDLQEIRRAAEHSRDLTQKLLAFSRMQIIVPKVLDLNETVTSMLTMLQRLIGENISLVWHPAAHAWPVKADPSQIDQILANLSINARDAISGVGKITIETENRTLDADYCAAHVGFVPGDYVLLAVSDDGCGMDKTTQAHLFEPFFTTKETGKGTGLGLATVYGIVKQNKGFINVYSEPGHGTTVNIYLVRHVGKAGQARTKGAARPVQRGRETILLVEDEPDTLKMATAMLTKQGYTVLAANTPGEAIRLAGTCAGEIHLLVTDVVMPEMNGQALAQNLQSIRPQLKRLFMSGYTANVIAHHGVLDEGVHFIQKPFGIKELAAKVRTVLDAP